MTCSRDFPPATPINNPGSAELSAALIRFVTDGLVATLEFYRAGRLPPHRFAWELAARTDTLAELHPASRAVTRLRWLQHRINNPRTEHTAGGQIGVLSTDEQNCLTVTLASLRATSSSAATTRTATTRTATATTAGRWPHLPPATAAKRR
jgi:hypothetical protein